MRLRNKIVLILLFFSVIPVVVVGFIETTRDRQALEQQIGANSFEFAQLALHRINEYLYSKFEDVRGWAETTGRLGIADQSQCANISRILTNAGRSHGEYYYVVVSNDAGEVVASSEPASIRRDISAEPGFRAAAAGRPSVQDVAFDTAADGYAVVISFPVVDAIEDSKTVGVVSAALKWEELNRMITEPYVGGSRQTKTDHLMLFNSEGLVISCYDPNRMFATNLIEIGMESARRALEKGEGFFLEDVTEHDIGSLVAYAYQRTYKDLPNLGWGLLVQQDPQRVFASVYSTKRVMTYTLLILIAVLAVMSFVFANMVSRPILAIASAAKAISGGNLSNKVEIRSRDEIGVLAASFNSMVENVKRSTEAVRQSAERFRAFVESATEGFSLWDSEFNLVMVNETTLSMFPAGTKREDIIGKNFVEIVPNIRETGPYEKYQQVMKTGEPLFFDDLVPDPKSGDRHISIVAFKVGAGLGIITSDITERKCAEQALRKSEASLALAQSIAGIGSWEWDTIADKVIWSDEMYRIFGFEPQQVEPPGFESYLNLVIPAQRQQVRNECERALAETKTFDMEYEIVRPDGIHRVLHSRAQVFCDENGKPVRMLGTVQDMTDRKQIQQRDELILQTSMDGFWVTDIEGNILEVNDAYCRMVDCSRDELLSMNISDVEATESRQEIAEHIRQIIELGSDRFESHHRRKDGTIVDTEISANYLPLFGGRIFTFFRDITKRKNVEEALRQSEERLRLALSAADMGTWRWDPVTNQDTRGASFNHILGLPAAESTQPVEDFLQRVHPDDRDMVDKKIQCAMRDGKPYLAECRIVRPDGEIRWLRDQGKVLCDEDGRVLYMTGAVLDITNRKRSEEELSVFRDKMVQAERLATLGTVAGALSHELTQPLTVIGLSLQNALADLEIDCPQTIKEGLCDSLSEVSNVVSMIKRLRGLARDFAEHSLGEVDVGSMMRKVVRLLEKSAQEARVSVRLKGIDSLPPVYGDRGNLEQSSFVLIQNAIQAADGQKARRLIISGAVKDRQVELRFSDNCCGISPEDLDKIFEPFFTTKLAQKGTGLGLCVVRHLVTQMGGQVGVASKPGKGTTFFVTLPTSRGGKSQVSDNEK